MKKVFALTALCCLMFSPAISAEIERGFINSNASVNKEMAPDTVEITIEVVTEDVNSLQVATVKNKELSDKVYNAMKSMVAETEGDYVKTSDFSAQPVYYYVNSKKNFEKYQVSNKVIVHTKLVQKSGELIDKAIELGATNIDNISFMLESYDTYCDELLVQAAKKSKMRAEGLALASGVRVVGVKNLSGSCNTHNSSPRIMYNMAAKSESMDSIPAYGATPISSGTIKLYANVNASYFVK